MRGLDNNSQVKRLIMLSANSKYINNKFMIQVIFLQAFNAENDNLRNYVMLLNVMQKEICFCRKRTQSYDSTFCGALTDTSHNNNNINKRKRRKRLVRNLSGFLAKIYPINVGFSSQFKLEHKQSSTEEQLTIYRTLRRYTPFSNYYLKNLL